MFTKLRQQGCPILDLQEERQGFSKAIAHLLDYHFGQGANTIRRSME
jgi:hypothetical protein